MSLSLHGDVLLGGLSVTSWLVVAIDMEVGDEDSVSVTGGSSSNFWGFSISSSSSSTSSSPDPVPPLLIILLELDSGPFSLLLPWEAQPGSHLSLVSFDFQLLFCEVPGPGLEGVAHLPSWWSLLGLLQLVSWSPRECLYVPPSQEGFQVGVTALRWLL